MKLSVIQMAMIATGLIIVILIVLLFTGVIPGLISNNSNTLRGTLTVWGVYDNSRQVEDSLIKGFNAVYPGVAVTYRQMNERTYEQDLINALAAGNGPDIFMVRNSWLMKHADKLAPLDPIEYPVTTVRELFPDVIAEDFTMGGQVFALPLYIDTLALFYNKTIFDNAGIAQPPKTWDEFQKVAGKLTRFNQNGQLTRSAAAIGSSSKNINAATDLLSLLMLQSDVNMVSPNLSEATFSGGNGENTLKYYTHFTQPRNPDYTWEPSFHYSIDAFGEEKTAMIFNYAYQAPIIREKNPFLNFAIAPMLQMKDAPVTKNYANYWGLGVSNKTADPAVAWEFIKTVTTDESINLSYLNATKRSPALRSVIDQALSDPTIGVFARQALTAVTWPQIDNAAIDASFTNMIDAVNYGQLTPSVAIRQAEQEITLLLRRRLQQQQQ